MNVLWHIFQRGGAAVFRFQRMRAHILHQRVHALLAQMNSVTLHIACGSITVGAFECFTGI